jgi:predicted 3-demethylubiquinone-9 3-methyltransferase (glyoxalase superfamily)
MAISTQKITPFLWFDNNAEEAANYYVGIFKNSKILSVNPVVTAFQLDGLEFAALNGGPTHKFSEAVSFVISCDGQEEVDYYRNAFTADGGQEGECGWLKDKYGVSWQVVPVQLMTAMGNPDRTKAQYAMEQMLKMKKIVIADLTA